MLKPNGMMVVVYAHKTTSGWVTLIDSLRRALTPDTSPLSPDGRGAGGEGISSQRTQEQQQIDTLLASWKRVVEENLFTQRK